MTGPQGEQLGGDDATVVLEMIEPLAGFAEHRSFALLRLDPDGTICTLQALDGSGLSFLAVVPHAFFPDYAPSIGDSIRKALGVRDDHDMLLLVLVCTGSTLTDTTANLLAPVVVNSRTHRAAQVMVDDSSLLLRAPLAVA
jgi:flagellar assembly factor FliW